MRNQKGFTLIELMVVVIIIGVLAAIAIPRFIGAQHKARVSAAKADVSIIREGLGLYVIDYGAYPNAATYATLRAALIDADGEAYVTLPAEGATIDSVGYAADSADGYHLSAKIIAVPSGYAHSYVGANEDSMWTEEASPY
ncbi:MAG: prepilin-type N-terminal cleavage/methylation domain-containing protein [bacterium]|nr:prepilin-type N-terminal cleavage/methylation domain-containing protein [bacterium]